jgi:DNA helicase HerA-like ATPase
MIRAEEQATNGAAVIALDENQTVIIDLPTLIETRAIIQANSGGGKSWAIRRILEQSHGKVQQIIIDVEGSFRTLREQFEYVLLGALSDDVDYPITPTNAALLATTLLEARTSVILDLYEFRPAERQQIVRHFLDALINAPKSLWHDCLIVLDEAHIFCPEQTDAEAKEAVEALCSRGRARGFCALLATQRISKLDKDAVAECNNKLIGAPFRRKWDSSTGAEG